MQTQNRSAVSKIYLRLKFENLCFLYVYNRGSKPSKPCCAAWSSVPKQLTEFGLIRWEEELSAGERAGSVVEVQCYKAGNREMSADNKRLSA